MVRAGFVLMFAGLNWEVHDTFERGGLMPRVGFENLFWSADQAIVEADRRTCALCKARQSSAVPSASCAPDVRGEARGGGRGG